MTPRRRPASESSRSERSGSISSLEKAAIRARVWDRLEERGTARFPFPPHGRIPNFAGAREAAERALALPELTGARRIKVNPDAPQRPLRLAALRRGIEVYMPTPRLRAGFLRFDPARIPADKLGEAASLSKGARWAVPAPLDDLPHFDALVVGSVAVSREGGRCGKGEGFADIEYGILRALGHLPGPVVTTVHPDQWVDALPREDTDLPVSLVVTPDAVVRIEAPGPGPSGIDWSRLTDEDLAEMPLLEELRRSESKRLR